MVLVRVSLLFETVSGVAQLEWPQEVRGFLEVGSASLDFMNEVLNAYNSVFAKLSFNDGVVSKGNAILVHLSVSSLINKLSDCGISGISINDPWLDNSDHVHGSFVKSNEDSIVDLSKSQQLEDFLGLGSKLVDTN